MTRPAFGADEGAGSILVVIAGAVVLLVVAAGAVVGDVLSARARAQNGADLASLAAAQVAISGRPDWCAVAASIASANGTTLVACRVDERSDVRVRVETTVTGPARDLAGRLGMDPPLAYAESRAGPPSSSRSSSTTAPSLSSG